MTPTDGNVAPVFRIINWASLDCLSDQLNANRRFSAGTSSASQMESQSPRHLPKYASSSRRLAPPWAHIWSSISDHGMTIDWAPFQSKVTEFALVLPIRKTKMTHTKVFFQSLLCMDEFHSQENPINIIKKTTPHNGVASSLCTGGAYGIISPDLQSCPHDFTSNYFSITSFSTVLTTRA